MPNIVKGGKNIYGFDIGMLMLDSRFPRIIGDAGNALTFDFPILYKTVSGYKPHKVVLELTKNDIEPFIVAARDLEKSGVKAVTTSCGFLALFQEEMQKELSCPVFTSALCQLPLIQRIIPASKRILVLTANAKTLTTEHLKGACGELDPLRCEIAGTEGKNTFTWFTVEDWSEVDLDLCEQDITQTLDEHLMVPHDYGAILLECTNLPPYSKMIRERYGLPVFDFVTLVNYVHSAVSQQGIV